MGLLDDKVIAVTGAASGIGAAIAEICLREGAHVAAGIHERKISWEPPEGSADRRRVIPIDAASATSVREAVSEIVAWKGRIDGLVCAAGLLRTGLLVAQDPLEGDEVIDVNLMGAVRAARAALPVMSRQRAGVLLFVSSVAALRPSRGQALYAASKAAIEGLTRAIAVEAGGRGVRALCLRPGPVDTEMLAATLALAPDLGESVPLGRVGKPSEIAEVAAFLLSDRASYLTGVVVPVEGGWTASASATGRARPR